MKPADLYQQALGWILEWHSEDDRPSARGFCQDCGTSWPCRTWRAADEVLRVPSQETAHSEAVNHAH